MSTAIEYYELLCGAVVRDVVARSGHRDPHGLETNQDGRLAAP